MESPRSRMARLSALLGVAALVFAACSSGTESAAPGGESPAAASAPAAGESPAGSAPAGSPAAGGGFQCENIGGEVSVYATWTGAEKDNFDAMMAPWLECSGVTMNYTGQRDLGAALTTAIAGGNLPDVAGLPGPGLMQQWYADGVLQPLDFVDYAAYEAVYAAWLRGSRTGTRRQARRHLHQGRRKGPDLVQHGRLDRAIPRPRGTS